MEAVLGGANKVVMDGAAGQGTVPYLPLNNLFTPKSGAAPGGSN